MNNKCNKEESGCTIGNFQYYDDGLLVDEFQLKHMKKKDLIYVDWFNFCPECGKSVKDKCPRKNTV